MEEFWLGMGISMVLNVLNVTVKNPGRRAQLAKAMTKLRDALLLQYPIEKPEA